MTNVNNLLQLKAQIGDMVESAAWAAEVGQAALQQVRDIIDAAQEPPPEPPPTEEPEPPVDPEPDFIQIRSFEELKRNWTADARLQIVEDIDWPEKMNMPMGMRLRVDAVCTWTAGPTTSFHLGISGPDTRYISGSGVLQGSLDSITSPPRGKGWMKGWGGGGIEYRNGAMLSVEGITLKNCNGIMPQLGGGTLLRIAHTKHLDSWRYGMMLAGPTEARATIVCPVIRRTHHEHDIRSYIDTTARDIETSGNRAEKIAYWGAEGHHDVRDITSDMRILFGPNFLDDPDSRVSFHCEEANVRQIGCWNGTDGGKIVNCPSAAVSFGSPRNPRKQPLPQNICWKNVRHVRDESWMAERNIKACED